MMMEKAAFVLLCLQLAAGPSHAFQSPGAPRVGWRIQKTRISPLFQWPNSAYMSEVSADGVASVSMHDPGDSRSISPALNQARQYLESINVNDFMSTIQSEVQPHLTSVENMIESITSPKMASGTVVHARNMLDSIDIEALERTLSVTIESAVIAASQSVEAIDLEPVSRFIHETQSPAQQETEDSYQAEDEEPSDNFFQNLQSSFKKGVRNAGKAFFSTNDFEKMSEPERAIAESAWDVEHSLRMTLEDSLFAIETIDVSRMVDAIMDDLKDFIGEFYTQLDVIEAASKGLAIDNIESTKPYIDIGADGKVEPQQQSYDPSQGFEPALALALHRIQGLSFGFVGASLASVVEPQVLAARLQVEKSLEEATNIVLSRVENASRQLAATSELVVETLTSNPAVSNMADQVVDNYYDHTTSAQSAYTASSRTGGAYSSATTWEHATGADNNGVFSADSAFKNSVGSHVHVGVDPMSSYEAYSAHTAYPGSSGTSHAAWQHASSVRESGYQANSNNNFGGHVVVDSTAQKATASSQFTSGSDFVANQPYKTPYQDYGDVGQQTASAARHQAAANAASHHASNAAAYKNNNDGAADHFAHSASAGMHDAIDAVASTVTDAQDAATSTVVEPSIETVHHLMETMNLQMLQAHKLMDTAAGVTVEGTQNIMDSLTDAGVNMMSMATNTMNELKHAVEHLSASVSPLEAGIAGAAAAAVGVGLGAHQNGRVSELESRLKSMMEVVESTQALLETSVKEYEQLKAENLQLRAALGVSEGKLADANQVISRLTHENFYLRAALAESHSHVATASDILSARQRQHSDMVDANDSLNEAISESERALEEFRSNTRSIWEADKQRHDTKHSWGGNSYLAQ